MESQKQTSFTFEIYNFSEKEGFIRSPNFSSGGCEWFVKVRHPKGHIVDDHLSLFLHVANPESLRLGWKRLASYSFVLLNQSGKELFRIDEYCSLFCAQMTGRGRTEAVPLKKLQKFMEKNKLIVKVEVKVVAVVDEGYVTGKETLDWLKAKLDEVSLEKKKSNVPVQELEEHIKNLTLELNKEKGKKDTCAAKVLSLEKTVSNLKYELNKEKRESAAKFLSLEQTVSDFEDEVSDLKDEVSYLEDELNKKKDESDTFAAKVCSLEQTVLNLKDELNKKEVESATCAAKVCSLEQTVLNLKDELKKEFAAACSWEVLDYEDLHNE